MTRTPDRVERYYTATQWQLMGRKLRHHTLGVAGGIILAGFYLVAILADFIAPYPIDQDNKDFIYAPPQGIYLFGGGGNGMRPFIYAYTAGYDEVTWRPTYVPDTQKGIPVRFFVHGSRYRFLGLFGSDIHLFGVREGTVFLFGTDKYGRDLFSRTLFASRISLTIGLFGVAISFVLGIILGGISGFFGGTADLVIQRLIEFLLSIPTIPLWMGLAAAVPPDWDPLKVYFGITVILSFVGWCGLARVVRGKFLELREADFVLAARVCGQPDRVIIARHLVPSFASYLIVDLTLSIPGMILGETSLSFLGLGIRAPLVSWGSLLKDAQQLSSVALHPWLLIPGLFVIVVVLSFNFLGDGLRDAADPYNR